MKKLESSTWSRQKKNEQLLSNARDMRKAPTKAEAILWEQLRNRKMNGAKFRRQQPFEGFILDFYCDSAQLCVEVDGDVHDDPQQILYDESRDGFLLEFRIRTIRFRNEEVENGLANVLNMIRENLGASPSPI